MDKLIQDLAIARRTVASYKAELAEIDAEVKAVYGERVEQLKEMLAYAQTQVTGWTEAVRGAALEAYQDDGNKHPHPAVTVKVFTKLEYDEEQAFSYCIQHLPAALKMDKRKFEKVAKVVEPDFVEVTQDPKATIARDLSEYE